MDRPQSLVDILKGLRSAGVDELIERSATYIPFSRLMTGDAGRDFKHRKVAGMGFLAELFKQRERRAADAIMGIDEAQKVERLEPDLAVEYARLAPLVSEAYVFLKVGETDAALKALQAAQEVVQTVSSPFFSSLMIKAEGGK